MSSSNMIYGSFKTNILQLNESNNYDTKEILVKPLSQKEFSDGWQQVIPKPIRKSKKIELADNITKYNNYKIYNVFNVNLAQIPNYLFKKIKEIYRDGKLKEYIVKDKRYLYKIELTLVDEEIRKLRQILNKDCFYENDLTEIRNLLNILNDNKISGCLTIEAENALI